MFVSSFIPKALFFGMNSNFLRNGRLLSAYSMKCQNKSYCNASTNVSKKVQNKLLIVNKLDTSCVKAIKRSVATTVPKSNTSTFQQMLSARKKQAQCSVLLELLKKDDTNYALGLCERFGTIENAFSFTGTSDNVYLLIEFDKEECVKELLKETHFKNILDVFPVSSRIVGYTRKCGQNEPKVSVKVVENTVNTGIKEGTVSDLIEHIYHEEKLTELNVRLRFFFCCIIKEMLSGPFPHSDAIPFGSSVNGIGRQGCDLDLMVRLYPEKIDSSSELYFVNKICVGDIQNLQRRVVYCIGDLLRTFLPGVYSVQKILHARVPIIKLEHKILGMDVDVSVNNMAPILMSELLYFCGEIDSRIRPLIHAVKKWAKEAHVTHDSPGSWFTNFSLTLLVIYFLQNRPTPVLPALNKFMNIIGAEYHEEYRIEFLMTVPELQSKASLNKESIAVLLHEFLFFLVSHSFQGKQISLLTGSALEKPSEHPVWIQYPFEEDLNVSKNVSEFELMDTCEKAHFSAQYLSNNLNVKSAHQKDLLMLLGVQDIRKLFINKSKRLDVSSLLGDDLKNMKKSGKRTYR